VGRLLALALLLAATAAADDGGRILFRPPGGQVRAGEVVELRWTALADDVDELELLLSVDGRWESPLRLTEQLDPRALGFLWRVPNLPTGAASLRIRFGGPAGETLAPACRPFAIVAAPSRPTAGVAWRRAEWWVVEPGAARRSPASRRPPAVTTVPRHSESVQAGLAPETPEARAADLAQWSVPPIAPAARAGVGGSLVAEDRHPLAFPMRP